MNDKIAVRFLRSSLPYNAGDIAGFTAEVAEKYIKDGLCELFLTPEQQAEADKKRLEDAIAEENRRAAEAQLKAKADAEAEEARLKAEQEAEAEAQKKAKEAAEAGSGGSDGQTAQTSPDGAQTQPEGTQEAGGETGTQADETKTEGDAEVTKTDEAQTQQPPAAQDDKSLEASANKMMTGKDSKNKGGK